jgi:hypothetical protein
MVAPVLRNSISVLLFHGAYKIPSFLFLGSSWFHSSLFSPFKLIIPGLSIGHAQNKFWNCVLVC